MNLGERARKLREDAGLSLSQASENMGISKAALWDFETSRKNNPTLRTMQRVADAYGISLSEFLSDAPKLRVSKEQLAAMIAIERALKAAYERGRKEQK